jgi:hypothetical protein
VDGKSLLLASAVIAASTAPAFSQRLSSRSPAAAPILAGDVTHDLSAFYIAANAGVRWLPYRNRFLDGARLGYNYESAAFYAPLESRLRSKLANGRQIEMASALTLPKVAGRTGDPFNGPNGTAFGELTPIASEKLSPSAAEFAMRLARAIANRDLLFGPNGALSAGIDSRNVAEMGVVVEGVNEPPQNAQSADLDASDAASGPIQTYPMSAAALAEQRALATKDGATVPAADAGAKILASADPPLATLGDAHLTRAFDASEGTRLDPLLNTTYDLNYPKVVPSLK